MRFLIGQAMLATAVAWAIAAGARAQSEEVAPLNLPIRPSLPSLYRSGGPPDPLTDYKASERELARKQRWVKEATAIARSGQHVVRDEENLYVYIDVLQFPRAVVMTTHWGHVNYDYLHFDEIGRFHVVREGPFGDTSHVLLISATTGDVYRVLEAPVFSPDRTKFFSAGAEGFGCTGVVSVYSYQDYDLRQLATLRTGCDHPCLHEWSGSTEVKAVCNKPQGAGKVEYRLTDRDGSWQESISDLPE
jgi:hypothetical protein